MIREAHEARSPLSAGPDHLVSCSSEHLMTGPAQAWVLHLHAWLSLRIYLTIRLFVLDRVFLKSLFSIRIMCTFFTLSVLCDTHPCYWMLAPWDIHPCYKSANPRLIPARLIAISLDISGYLQISHTARSLPPARTQLSLLQICSFIYFQISETVLNAQIETYLFRLSEFSSSPSSLSLSLSLSDLCRSLMRHISSRSLWVGILFSPLLRSWQKHRIFHTQSIEPELILQ